MAKYGANVTQTVNPSAPDPAAAARAAASNANIFTAAVKGGMEAYGMYKQKTMKDLQAEAEQASIDFLTSNQQAQDAGRMLAPVVEKARNMAVDINNLGGSEFDMEVAESQRKQLEGVMAGAMRLKQAADAGMSPTEYMTRVQALTKRAIAQFPGLANDIRQTVMQSTGLPFADDATAAVKYTREIFGGAGKGGGEGDKNFDTLMREDAKLIIDQLAPQEGGDAIYAGLKSRDPKYVEMLGRAREASKAKIAAEQLSAARQAEEAQGIKDFRRINELTVQEAAAKTYGEFAVFAQRHSATLGNIAKAYQTSNGNLSLLGQSADIKAQLEMLKVDYAGIIRRNFSAARQKHIDAKTQGRISTKDYEDGIKTINDQEKLYLDNFSEENALQTFTILANHRGKTIEEQARILTTNTQFMSLFGQNVLAQKYFGGTDRDRQEVRETDPRLAEVLDAHIKPTNAAANTINLLSSKGLLDVGNALKDGRENTNPTPAASNDEMRLKTAAVTAEVKALLDRYNSDPNATPLSLQEQRLVMTMMSNMTAYGTPEKPLRENFVRYQENFKKLPPEHLEVFKNHAANLHVTAGASINGALADYDKQGIKLTLGAMPSGRIGVVPPAEFFTNKPPTIAQSGSRGWVSAEERGRYNGYFSKYPDFKNIYVKQGMEEKLREYEAAAERFESKNVLVLNNMVLQRALLTGEAPKKAADEYSAAFSARQPIQPFFSSAPTGVSLVEPGKAQPTSKVEADMAAAVAAPSVNPSGTYKTVIESLKKDMDKMTPEQKMQFAKALKELEQ